MTHNDNVNLAYLFFHIYMSGVLKKMYAEKES